jgi:hypothetical protein
MIAVSIILIVLLLFLIVIIVPQKVRLKLDADEDGFNANVFMLWPSGGEFFRKILIFIYRPLFWVSGL